MRLGIAATICAAAILQLAIWAGGSTGTMTRRIEWKKTKLSSEEYESVGVFDVNNDGKPDIVSGAYWYEAPNWTRHKVCDVTLSGAYYDDFSTIPMDVNGDGYLDFITGGWGGGRLEWRENPKGQPVEWKTHLIAETGNIETTRAWDVDGDGRLEICPNNPGMPLCYFKLILDDNGKGTGRFSRVQVQPEGAQGHGLGFGDVLTNGKGCFITNSGFWEPVDIKAGKWEFHQEWNFGSASVPIIAADVNGDGVNEIVVGQAHGYGLDYYTVKNENGKRVWTKHPIDPYFSQYHEMLWVDIDGDGKCELVTGNRYHAHMGHEPGETDICGLWYFKWNGESFTKCVVDYGKVPDHSGTGIFMSVADVNGDGRLDIVAAGKDGLYLFENLGPEQVGVK